MKRGKLESNRYLIMRKTIFFTMIACVLALDLRAQEDPFDVTLEDESSEDFSWMTPAGKYLDPTSFFSFHGYVNSVFAGKSEDWTVGDPTQLGPPGQLLVPNTSESAFQFDAALIIGSELTDRTRLIFESHFVSDPKGAGAAGPGGLTIALTEVAASFDIVPKHLTISGGLFWNPFGIANKDWLGAQNQFSLIPRASAAYPVHYNERGVRLNGYFPIAEGAGINYVVSVGNGVSNFNISGQSSFDRDNAKTVTARIGIFPGMGKDLDIGLSWMSGKLRDQVDTLRNTIDPSRYAASTNAVGLDATYKRNNIAFTGYYILSKEHLDNDGLGNNPGFINRSGWMTELSYLIKVGKDHFYGIKPKVRFDNVAIENLNLDSSLDVSKQEFSSSVFSFGTNIHVTEGFYFSIDYNIATENDQEELANNRFLARISAQF